jgi:hypothetical protein
MASNPLGVVAHQGVRPIVGRIEASAYTNALREREPCYAIVCGGDFFAPSSLQDGRQQ